MWSVLPTQLFTNLGHIRSQSLIICVDFVHEFYPYIFQISDELLLELFGYIFILFLHIPAKKLTLHKKHIMHNVTRFSTILRGTDKLYCIPVLVATDLLCWIIQDKFTCRYNTCTAFICLSVHGQENHSILL